MLLAPRLAISRGRAIARVAAVQAEVPSAGQEMVQAAASVGARQIRPGQAFAVRIHKRGVHGYLAPTPALEREAGTAVWRALKDRDGSSPHVDLDHPDVTLHVEVLGPRSLVCVSHRVWPQPASTTAPT